MLVSRHFTLSRLKTLRLLDELETADGKAMSLFAPPSLPASEVEGLLEKAAVPQVVATDISELITGSQTGAVLFWGLPLRYLVLPPFPVTEKYVAPGYDVEPLRSQLTHPFSIALVLVRLGAYAIGVCQGEKLIASKTGTGLVHGRHKKGGSSQRRFARRREKQIDTFLERVSHHVQQQLEPHAAALDYLVYGGARASIRTLQEQCPFLHHLKNRTLPPLLNIPRPRRSVLEAAVGDIWSSSVTKWYDDQALDIDS